jgi:demethylmenaquinone methyltransferase/2-methoxy-6-polyprenyl-1,4-benzoquinol methylase
VTNEFYSPDEKRALKVKELFARIAPRYDFVNHVQSFGLHLLWKRKLVDLAHVRAGESAIDVCCGTGDLAFALARKGAKVVGVDFTPAMLEVAETRSRREIGTESKGDAVRFVCGDAMQIPFPDDSFEIVTVGYGLRNLSNWETGLRELQRVAKPGGRLLVLEFGKPDNAVWRALYFTYLKIVLPVFGLVFCGSAAAYGYVFESLKHYPSQKGVTDKMLNLGLVNVRIVNFLGGIMSINYGEKVSPNSPIDSK